jgi:hypothetical protein
MAIAPGGQTELIMDAAKAGALAVIGIVDNPSGEIVGCNTMVNGGASWPIPVLVTSSRNEQALLAAVKYRGEVVLKIEGTENLQAEAKNVVGRLNRGKELIIVSTPQSGWFRCAGERGVGVALFLGLARWAGQRQTNTSYLFVSTSGHELGAQGVRSFLNEMAPPVENVRCWLHLGASMAAWRWEKNGYGWRQLSEPNNDQRYLRCTSDLLPILEDAFSDVQGLNPLDGRTLGELSAIMEKGYRAFGFFGAHHFFHTPEDGPEVTAPELLEPLSISLTKALAAIEREKWV